MRRLAMMVALMAIQGAPQDRRSVHDEVQSALESAARSRRALREAQEDQKKAELEVLIRGLLEDAPACVAAWNAWIGGIGPESQIRDYRDRKRFHAARRSCEKVFRGLSKFYGKENH